MAVFDAQSNRRITRSVLWTEKQIRPGVGRGRHRRPIQSESLQGGVAKVTSAITAFDPDTPPLTPGEGMIQPYAINDEGELVPRGDPVKCYTIAAETPATTWIQYKIDDDGNKWIDVELCE